MSNQSVIEKFSKKSATIGVVGLGYVGLPLAIGYIESGVKVIGFDIDDEKIQKLSQSQTYIKHIPSESIKMMTQSGRFQATTDFSRAAEADVLIMCVPTPLDQHQAPDLSYVINTIESLLPAVRKGQLVCLESTTYPGTTEEEIKPRLESRGLKVGQDIFLVFSPEREDPGNEKFTTKDIPKVLGGSTPMCLEVGMAAYGLVFKKLVPVSSTQTAEMAKLLENIYRSINIGLVNEIKIVCDRMGIDVWEVIDAAATKPFGFTPFYPGPGLGGHCIPIDPFYLTWKAKEYGINTRFIELAGEVNTNMPKWVYGKVAEALNDQKKPIRDSKVLVLGVSYKKNVDDCRESPSVQLMEIFREKGANVMYSDPFFPKFPKMREHKFDLASVELTEANIKSMDCIVVATDHAAFDYELLQKHASLIVDTRGVYRKPFKNVVKA